MTYRPRGLAPPLLALALAVLLAACASAPRAAAAPPAHPLILISIDGFRADYLDRGLTPALRALADGGVRAEALRPSFPTLTFPNHYTLVTGLYPDHSGIVHNRMVDPATGRRFVYNDTKTIVDPRWWKGEPLWVGVERHGWHAATMFWVGSEVAIDGVRPSYWFPFDAKIGSRARVEQVLAWLDLPPAERPALTTLYFDAVDHAGHDFGPDSPELARALGEIDAAIGALVDGLAARGRLDSTDIVIVSDHGMAPSGPDRTIVLDDLVPLDAIDLINSGVVAGIAPKRGRRAEVERALLAPHDHLRCWRKGEMPARFHYGHDRLIPPIVCVADSGWVVATAERAHDPARKASLGEHGYDNDDPTMRALFVAHGPAFARGLVVPEFDNVHVYALLARVLGLRAAPNDGDANATAAMRRER